MAEKLNNYRLTGDYGTFAIQRTVRAASYDAAWCETGIATTLFDAGWSIIDSPDGEVWTIEQQADDGTWFEIEEEGDDES